MEVTYPLILVITVLQHFSELKKVKSVRRFLYMCAGNPQIPLFLKRPPTKPQKHTQNRNKLKNPEPIFTWIENSVCAPAVPLGVVIWGNRGVKSVVAPTVPKK
jgi:hypothetical protein